MAVDVTYRGVTYTFEDSKEFEYFLRLYSDNEEQNSHTADGIVEREGEEDVSRTE